MWLGLVAVIQLHRQTSLPLGLMKFYVTHQYSCNKWVQRRWWPSQLRAAPGRRWPASVAGRCRGATCTVWAGGLCSWNPARWTGSPVHRPEGSETERECRVYKRCDRGLVLSIFLQNQKYDHCCDKKFVYLSAVLYVPLIFVDQQHVRSPWQPGSFEANEEEQPGADVAPQPQGKLHLRGSEGDWKQITSQFISMWL